MGNTAKLTPLQRDRLEAYRRLRDQLGRPPSLNDLIELFGIEKTSVLYWIARLKVAGEDIPVSHDSEMEHLRESWKLSRQRYVDAALEYYEEVGVPPREADIAKRVGVSREAVRQAISKAPLYGYEIPHRVQGKDETVPMNFSIRKKEHKILESLAEKHQTSIGQVLHGLIAKATMGAA